MLAMNDSDWEYLWKNVDGKMESLPKEQKKKRKQLDEQVARVLEKLKPKAKGDELDALMSSMSINK